MKTKVVRLPARDGKTPSNYIRKANGEVWYSPIPKPAPKPQGKSNG